MDTPLPKLVVFGEALTDFVRTGDRTWHTTAGGSCWNVARAAATLGMHAGWAGAVSDDLFGHEIIEKSRVARLDMRFVQVVQRPPLVAIVYQSTPPKYFFLGEGTADLHFNESELPSGWFEACEIAHFGCISLVRQPLGQRLMGIAERLKKAGKRISFDPNHRVLMGATYPALFEQMTVLSDIIKISAEDLVAIYPKLSEKKAIARVRSLAPEALLLYTRGVDGMALYSSQGIFEQPAFRVEVVDTVGAGDAFLGGFLASIMHGGRQEITHHLRFSAAAAAAACMRDGAYAPSPVDVNAVILRE